MKNNIFLRILAYCICIMTIASLCIISVSAKTVSEGANSKKAYLTISTNSLENITIYKLSCREKHKETGALNTVTGFNSSGNTTSLGCVIKPHTGYKFIKKGVTYNFYKYSISGTVTGPVKLTWER